MQSRAACLGLRDPLPITTPTPQQESLLTNAFCSVAGGLWIILSVAHQGWADPDPPPPPSPFLSLEEVRFIIGALSLTGEPYSKPVFLGDVCSD